MSHQIAKTGTTDWHPDRLPDLSGKLYVITGGNSGIGFEAARMLGRAGGDLVLACRSPAKAEDALAHLRGDIRGAAELLQLDLADSASIRTAAEELRGRHTHIDGLINNAGIMQTPQLTTRDGFELQLGTNHLGHFLWTSLLIDLVEAAPAGRVVTVSSIAHKFGRIDLDDLMSETGYTPSKAYAQSKLANLMFALELDRRLMEAGATAISLACHPGYSNTALQSTGPRGFFRALYKLTNPLMSQPADKGAIPTVLAAAGTEARGGTYVGPTGMGDARGPVGDAQVAEHALDRAVWARLWEESEKLIGAPFAMPAPAKPAETTTAEPAEAATA